jgi:DNA-binding NarL/FixJ family response regulator
VASSFAGPCQFSPPVDDHPLGREGIRGILAAYPDIEVVGQASDGIHGVDVVRRLRPDLVLMDLRMPGGDRVTATREIVFAGLSRVVVLTTYETDQDILRAVEAGATGYLLKDIAPDELAHAVRAAARGETVLAPSAQDALLHRVQRPRPRRPLSRHGRSPYSRSPPRGAPTPRSARRCSQVRLTVDGIPLINNAIDAAKFRFQSPAFTITFAPNNDLGFPAGTYNDAYADGYWLMLDALSAGQHTLHFGGTSTFYAYDGGQIAVFSVDTTVRLNVVPGGGPNNVPLPAAVFLAPLGVGPALAMRRKVCRWR